jgi:hypothetical protein
MEINVASPNTQLQNLLNLFANSIPGGASSTLYQDVFQAITSSPALLSQFDSEANSGELQAITYSPTAGTFFTPSEANPAVGTLTLGEGYLVALQSALGTGDAAQAEVINTYAFVLGHEGSHVSDSDTVNSALTTDYESLDTTIQNYNSGPNSGTPQDLTSNVQTIVNQLLQDEGQANIVGWNDVVSMAVAANGNAPLSQAQLATLAQNTPTSQTLFNTSSGTSLAPLTGISVNSDGTIATSSANIQAAANIQANQEPSTNPGMTYSQLEADAVLSQISSQENGTPFAINYSTLGLTQAPNSGNTETTAQADNFLNNNLQTGSTGTSVIINSADGSTNTFTSTPTGTQSSTTAQPSELPPGVTDTATADQASSETSFDSQVTSTSTSGRESFDFFGSAGDTSTVSTQDSTVLVDGQNYNLSLAAGDALTVTGNTDSFTFGTGDTATVTGNSNTLNLGTSDSVTVTGTGETVSDTVNLGGNSSVTVSGAGNEINTALEDSVTASNATINAETNVASGTSLSGTTVIDGTGNTVDAAQGAQLSFDKDGTSNTLNGADNFVILLSNDTLTLTGANDTIDTTLNDTVNASDTTIEAEANAAADTRTGVTDVQGAGNTIDGATDAAVDVDGNTNHLVLNTGDTATLTGTGETVSSTSDTVNLGGNSSVTVSGAGNVINTALDDSVTASNATINAETNVASGTSLSGTTVIDGTGNTVDAAQGAQLSFDEAGVSNTLNGADNFVVLLSNDTLTSTGANDTIDATQNDTVNASNTTIWAQASEVAGTRTGVTDVQGEGNTIDGATDAAVDVDGNSNHLVLNTGDTATLAGTGETVSATSDTVSLGNSSTATITGAGNTLSDGTSDTETVDGNNNALTLGTGDTATLSGTGEAVSATSDTVLLGNSSTVTVTGAGDVFNGALSNTIVTALNDTVNASNATIEAGSNSTTVSGITTIDGTSDIVGGPSGSVVSLDEAGSANTLESAGLITSIASNQTLFTVASDTDETIITAQNDMVDASNDTIEAGSNSSTVAGVTTIEGTGNSISGPSGSVVALGDVGSANTLTSAGLVTFMASNETVVTTAPATGETIVTALNDQVDATDSTIEAGSNSTTVSGVTTIGGTGDSIEGPSGSVVALVAEGSDNTLTSAGLVAFTANNETLNSTASGDTIVTASNNKVDASDDTIEAEANSNSVAGVTTIDGAGNNITTPTNSTLDVSGNSNDVHLDSGDTLDITGTDETIDASGDTIDFVGNDDGDTIVGTGNNEEGDGSGLPPDGDGGDGDGDGDGGYGGGYDAVPTKGKGLATTTLRTEMSSSTTSDHGSGLTSRLGWSDPALISMSDDGWATTGRIVGQTMTSELGLGTSAGVVASALPETPTQAAAWIVSIQRGTLQASTMRAPASGLSASVSSGVDRLVQALAALPGRSAATTAELAAEAGIGAESQIARPWSLDKLHVARPVHLP